MDLTACNVEEATKFSMNVWYPVFEDCCVKTLFVEVPSEMVEIFRSPENFVPDDAEIETTPALDKFCTELRSAIAELGGVTYARHNWRSPKDAAPFSLQRLMQFTNPNDVIELFTYSDEIMEDFRKDVGDMTFIVALQKYLPLHPAGELRCIIINNRLVGVTPRVWPRWYYSIASDAPQIIARIGEFFNSKIKPRDAPDKNYAMDIYVTDDKITLCNFKPLHKKTKYCAFEWDEIKKLLDAQSDKDVAPVFRYLEDDMGITPLDTFYTQTI